MRLLQTCDIPASGFPRRGRLDRSRVQVDLTRQWMLLWQLTDNSDTSRLTSGHAVSRLTTLVTFSNPGRHRPIDPWKVSVVLALVIKQLLVCLIACTDGLERWKKWQITAMILSLRGRVLIADHFRLDRPFTLRKHGVSFNSTAESQKSHTFLFI